MWQMHYIRAREMHEERLKEAEQTRLASAEPGPPPLRRSGVTGLRRRGAGLAMWVARRLDPGAARAASRRTPRKVGSI